MLNTLSRIGRGIAAKQSTAKRLTEKGTNMKRNLGFLGLLAILSLGGACNSGVVETNANTNKNMNANTAPANVGVVTNNNGNKNTAGVAPINGNANNNQNR
jgi:hypothetical protein